MSASVGKIFNKGILTENPVFKLFLGMCPALGVTALAENGLGMGISTMIVLIAANVVISAIRNMIPKKIRIPCFIVVIATFVTIVDMVLGAYLPALHDRLGVFIPLIVVNCLILGRAEAFASKNSIVYAALDGIAMGIGFTISLTALGAFRELFGAGTLFGMNIFNNFMQPIEIFAEPAGAFIALGLLVAIVNIFYKKLAIE